jgi:hypothetical protein
MNKSTPISELPIIGDDDETIQEVLKGFNQEIPQMPSAYPVPSNPHVPMYAMPVQQSPLDKMKLDIFWDRDVKFAILLAIVALLIIVLPSERFIYSYVNLDHLPYAQSTIKAFMIGASYYVLSKIIQ